MHPEGRVGNPGKSALDRLAAWYCKRVSLAFWSAATTVISYLPMLSKNAVISH
jgi:hypothetical protein